nr:MAG TPA: hypothetical protein [Caudoviricetes sp.]
MRSIILSSGIIPQAYARKLSIEQRAKTGSDTG